MTNLDEPPGQIDGKKCLILKKEREWIWINWFQTVSNLFRQVALSKDCRTILADMNILTHKIAQRGESPSIFRIKRKFPLYREGGVRMKVLLDFCRFHKLLYFRMTMVQIAKTVQDSRGIEPKRKIHQRLLSVTFNQSVG
ncbi:hypothetical protein M2L37_001224 [Staphylococcus pseudintermedius]|uniref:Uncharacterized protein n=2 Tax=Staphylococcus pseudintermedius TaxID=283734 RepID=A0A8H9BVF1_STAPS|nr:hypothetical protein [Staphylococcus pseudintermedius]EIK0281843.1 hypothetical protein [Staphylococcus pseudintermedius]EJD5662301.1 hypothetical protein [Staphylococcus pseudintermedius]MBM0330555.1 hypothetical protein [Staphylococcus pseudintermedius]MBM0374764.1 hypothetical protein [Staphylococcus pseudintermedius]